MKKLQLHWKIMIAMLLGIIWAMISGYAGWNKITIDWIDPFGTIFINSLKFIAIPLVLFSIVTGVAGLGDVRQLGRMGAKTLLLYLLTTVFAVSIGLFVVNSFNPGIQKNETTKLQNRLEYELWAKEANIPLVDNKNALKTADSTQVKAAILRYNAEKSSDEYQKLAAKNEAAQSTANRGPLQPLVDIVPENLIKSLMDPTLMLQVITFALFFGISLALLPRERVHVVAQFFDGMNEIFVKMVHIIMSASPFFVFCLMSGVLAKSASNLPELLNIFITLGWYSLNVLGGLLLLLFGFYPLLLKLFGVKISYADFFRGLSPAQFLAFSTSSSAATLPVTIECVENNLKVPKSVTDFVLPIGATVNMDGTSLYQAVAVIFLAQYHDIDLTIAQQLGIVATTTLASIGAAAVPGAGLIMLMIVLTSVGLNPLWVVLIMPMDRLLDMCRTVVNVTSDATVASIIARGEEKRNSN
jgi:Na+/H+-dicarboxylate symporter